MQGLRGSTRAGFRVINGQALRPLPPIGNSLADLAGIAGNMAEIPSIEPMREFDVFISHAGEDKDDVVRPMAVALQEAGLTVWYDEIELRIGDSLRRKIDAGIARSRFGVVVLSAAFFAKSWPQYELDGLVTMSVSGKQVLLPLWHNISNDEVISASPSFGGQGCPEDGGLQHRRDRHRDRRGRARSAREHLIWAETAGPSAAVRPF